MYNHTETYISTDQPLNPSVFLFPLFALHRLVAFVNMYTRPCQPAQHLGETDHMIQVSTLTFIMTHLTFDNVH